MQRVRVTERVFYEDAEGTRKVLNPGESVLMDEPAAISFVAAYAEQGAVATPEPVHPEGVEYGAEVA